MLWWSMQACFWRQAGGSSSVDPWSLGLTGNSLFTVKWELMKPTQRPSVSLVTETGLFWWPHKWWSTLKSAVFLTSLLLHPLVNEGGVLVCESVGKADLLNHYDSKQSREAVDLLLTCHMSPSLTTFAFRLREVVHLLLDLGPYVYPLGMFPLFPKRTTAVVASALRGLLTHK